MNTREPPDIPRTADHDTNPIFERHTISDNDMASLKNIDLITDYGSASAMPVYGGKLTLGSVLSVIFRSR